MPLVEDKIEQKRWLIRQNDLKVYNIAKGIIGGIFTLIFLPVIILGFVGQGCDYIQQFIAEKIVNFLATWATAIVLRKHKEYPTILRIDS